MTRANEDVTLRIVALATYAHAARAAVGGHSRTTHAPGDNFTRGWCRRAPRTTRGRRSALSQMRQARNCDGRRLLPGVRARRA